MKLRYEARVSFFKLKLDLMYCNEDAGSIVNKRDKITSNLKTGMRVKKPKNEYGCFKF